MYIEESFSIAVDSVCILLNRNTIIYFLYLHYFHFPIGALFLLNTLVSSFFYDSFHSNKFDQVFQPPVPFQYMYLEIMKLTVVVIYLVLMRASNNAYETYNHVIGASHSQHISHHLYP